MVSGEGSPVERLGPGRARDEEILRLRARIEDLAEQLAIETRARQYWEEVAHELQRSTSWRLTAPLRRLADLLRRHRTLPAAGAADRDPPATAPPLLAGEDEVSETAFTDAPLVDVVICVHNQFTQAERCIRSVMARTVVPIRLIIVDDGSGPATAAALTALEIPRGVRLRNERALGYTRAANQGLSAGSAPFALLLNSDTVVTRGWLSRMLAVMEQHPETGLVGPVSNNATYQTVPRLRDASGGWAVEPLPLPLTLWAEVVRALAPDAAPQVPTISGFCWLVRRALLDQIGLLDEAFSPEGYGEENDFARRAAAAGWSCRVALGAFVFHEGSQTFGARAAQLTATAHGRYIERYGAGAVAAWEQAFATEPHLETLRRRLARFLECEGSFLFVLPVPGWTGGVLVVQETIRALRALGQRAVAAVPAALAGYPGPLRSNERVLYAGWEELVELARGFDVILATHHTSVDLVAQVADELPHIRRAYFVQDDEARFYPAGSAGAAAARASFERLGPGLVYAISPWVVERLGRRGIRATLVRGGIDQDVYDPCRAILPGEGPPRIAAMIRPSTPWRNPTGTLALLRRLAEAHPQVEFCTFGCTHAEVADLGPLPPRCRHEGVVNPRALFELLRRCDIFVDASHFQAFGRTALEAMAAGCVVVGPREGGMRAFTDPGVTGLLVDTGSEAALVDAVGGLIEAGPGARRRMAQAAVRRALEFSSIRSAVLQMERLTHG